MNIYCKNKVVLEDGTIVYKKENIIFDNFDILQENDEIKLKPKKKIITINDTKELNEYNLNGSIIKECFINNKRPSKNKYYSILIDIYKLIGDGTKIIKNSSMNIKTKNEDNKGFRYNDELGISVQNADANKTFKEIVNQCLINKYTLQIEINLSNDKVIIFNV